jgi:hypothetical protein
MLIKLGLNVKCKLKGTKLNGRGTKTEFRKRPYGG